MHGWFNLFKPAGITSAHLLNKLKWNLPRKTKVGHAGTLDKFACGVLPVAVGEATKTMPYMVDTLKEYVFHVKWGVTTDSYDTEGEVVDESDFVPSVEAINQVLPCFVGEVLQKPPIYSALKVNGKRMSDRARNGEHVEVEPRPVRIYNLTHLRREAENIDAFIVTCSKGTYVRSLAIDIARQLQACAHVCYLKRSRVGSFTEKNAFALETQNDIAYKGTDLVNQLLPIRAVLDDIPAVPITQEQADKLRKGMAVSWPNSQLTEQATVFCQMDEMPIAICNFYNKGLHPKRVFNI